MELRPIKTESDYQNALIEIERLFDAKPNSLLLDRLDILTTLVEAYEQEHYPIDAPDPISAILYYLSARGLSHQDLAASIGDTEQVTAILNRQQALNLDAIRRLNQDFGIPAEVLIKPYSLSKTSA
ncbi:transcriptional regulator [Waterburya agarophytonicola K14]|uniref:Transcriptional regulator n=1 Tax=Waterburya agarophytonicola KI4 TaxID=2874699 RepID=A0A964BUB4_9CYAN|nr:transcriptional regulator [Waterburya agarophytonicola]MCC0179929.1 transcriptional regulator [Waterburya agarophytonicola KI4]